MKTKNHDKEDILSENLIIADVKKMSREDLEKFADRMRIDRNSFLIEKETLEDKIQELETELYFCGRNKKIEELVDG